MDARKVGSRADDWWTAWQQFSSEPGTVALDAARPDDARVTTIPKFQTCPRDGERIPTQFEIQDDEIEFPGVHVCSKGHAFLTRLDPRPGAPTIDTADVKRVD